MRKDKIRGTLLLRRAFGRPPNRMGAQRKLESQRVRVCWNFRNPQPSCESVFATDYK